MRSSPTLVAGDGPWKSWPSTPVARCFTLPEPLGRRSTSFEGLDIRVSDGRSLPHPDRAFDIAHASLVLHHLEREEAVAFLAEMARVARLGIVINDLDRGRMQWIGAWLIAHLMTGNRYTRHDGPLSVLRAYRRRETRELLAEAGLRPVGEFGGVMWHRYAIAAIRA